MRKMVRQGQKIPSIQSLDLGCAHVSSLQYNVSIGMTVWVYGPNRISLFKCCAETMNFSGTQLKYDLRDRKEAYTRAVPQPGWDSRGLWMPWNAAGPLHLLLTWWPLMEAKGWSTVTSGPIQWGVLFLPSHISSCFSCTADCCYLAFVNSWLCNIQIMQPAAL